MDSPVFFGEWVKRRRKALDLPQEELAQRADSSKFPLRKIESEQVTGTDYCSCQVQRKIYLF